MFQLIPASQLQPGDTVEASARFATYVGHPELTGQALTVESVEEFDGLQGPIVGIKLAGTNLVVHASADAGIMAETRQDSDHELADYLADEFPGVAASLYLGNVK